MSPILGVFTFVAVALAVPPITSAKQCTTNSECPSDNCCLLSPMRYSIPSCLPFLQRGDLCRLNAETVTSNLTYPNNHSLHVERIHYIVCPCADGLSCDSKNHICN